MSISKISYTEKTAGDFYTAADANQVKESVNDNADQFVDVSNALRVATVAGLKAFTFETVQTDKANFPIQLLGYYEAGDGGGGLFYVDTNDTTTPEDGGMVFVTNGGLRIKRNSKRLIRPEYFGAKSDKDFDNAAIFIKIKNYVESRGGGVIINGNKASYEIIDGTEWEVDNVSFQNMTFTKTQTGGSAGNYAIRGNNCNKWYFSKVNFNRSNSTQSGTRNNGIRFSGTCSDITFRNCDFSDTYVGVFVPAPAEAYRFTFDNCVKIGNKPIYTKIDGVLTPTEVNKAAYDADDTYENMLFNPPNTNDSSGGWHVIENCYCENLYTLALFSTSRNSTAKNNYVKNTIDSTIYCRAPGFQAYGNYLINNGKDAIKAVAEPPSQTVESDKCRIESNYVENASLISPAGSGLVIFGDYGILADNYFIQNIEPNDDSLRPLNISGSHGRVTGNTVLSTLPLGSGINGLRLGLNLFNASTLEKNIVVERNTFDGIDKVIEFTSETFSVENLTVKNNTVLECSNGMVLSGPNQKNTVVKGNIFTSLTDNNGIVLTGADTPIISNNVITDSPNTNLINITTSTNARAFNNEAYNALGLLNTDSATATTIKQGGNIFDGVTDSVPVGQFDTYNLQVETDGTTHEIGFGRAGYGTLIFGDNEERANFWFNADGSTIVLANESANVVNTNTTAKVCICLINDTVLYRNRTGVAKPARLQIQYV